MVNEYAVTISGSERFRNKVMPYCTTQVSTFSSGRPVQPVPRVRVGRVPVERPVPEVVAPERDGAVETEQCAVGVAPDEGVRGASREDRGGRRLPQPLQLRQDIGVL